MGVEQRGQPRIDAKAETTNKDFWRDPVRVAARYNQDPENPGFLKALAEFNRVSVEAAKVTISLSTFFEREFPQFSRPSSE